MPNNPTPKTPKPPKPPSYYMLGEKFAYSNAWRAGFERREQPKSKWPNATSKGYWEGRHARDRHDARRG